MIDGVGGIGACLFGLFNKVYRAIERFFGCQHKARLGAGGNSVNCRL